MIGKNPNHVKSFYVYLFHSLVLVSPYTDLGLVVLIRNLPLYSLEQALLVMNCLGLLVFLVTWLSWLGRNW